MEHITIKKLKNDYPRAALRLEAYFKRNGVDFVEERANILVRGDGHLRCRVRGGSWHRIDWNAKNGSWKGAEG